MPRGADLVVRLMERQWGPTRRGDYGEVPRLNRLLHSEEIEGS